MNDDDSDVTGPKRTSVCELYVTTDDDDDDDDYDE
jgi:hypothetical protein